MPKYQITRQYTYFQDVQVEADSVSDAVEKVLSDGGTEVGDLRYGYAFDDIEPSDVTNLDTGENGTDELEREL